MQNRKQPSILRILNTDFKAGIVLAAPVFFWFSYLCLAIFRVWPWLVWVCLACTLLGIGLAAYRCWVIIAVFERGLEAEATLTGVWFRKERGRLEFDYTFQGEKYNSSCAIMKTDQSEDLQAGETVRLVFDPQKPQNAFIIDLYVK
jgi:hypothetical protein